MWSFVALRVQRPYVERPFLVPGGLPVAVLLTVVPVAISIAYAAIIATESTFLDDADAAGEQRSRASDGGLPPVFQVVSMLAIIGLGLAVHLSTTLWHRATAWRRSGGGPHALPPLPPSVGHGGSGGKPASGGCGVGGARGGRKGGGRALSRGTRGSTSARKGGAPAEGARVRKS